MSDGARYLRKMLPITPTLVSRVNRSYSKMSLHERAALRRSQERLLNVDYMTKGTVWSAEWQKLVDKYGGG